MSDIRIQDGGSSVYNGITVDTPYEEANKGVKVEDFLQLMIAQLTNQDFMNPADDTQYVTQLAQFATMQSMQELSYYSQTNYVTALVGKSVTVATLGVGGAVDRETGIVTSVNLSGDEYTLTVNGKTYKMNQVMSVSDPTATVSKTQLDNAYKMAVISLGADTNSVSVRWDAPTEDEALKADLVYDVYYTENGAADFSTLGGVKQGRLAAQGVTDTTFTVNGLEPGKQYTVNVVVRSKSGDEAVYQSTTVNTQG